MAASQESVNMALFCDFENVALGVRDSKYDQFDIRPVLERLLLKGSIVVKKAYCDWDRYKDFKKTMHEASFELIEIPHVRQSGKNSADIRLVVDALDLCYTKSHVDTFVIISGDSDFSPLVSKLRENAKKVIGVGVKNSTSDLLVANCDEFIFYEDLMREQQRSFAKREAREGRETKRASNEEKPPKIDPDARKSHAIAIAVETFEALASERGESGKIWASVLKSAIKRRKPGFSEAQYGFRAFGNLLDEAQARGLLEVGRDEKNGAFVSRAGSVAAAAPVMETKPAEAALPSAPHEADTRNKKDRRGSRRERERERMNPAPLFASAPPAEEFTPEPVEEIVPPVEVIERGERSAPEELERVEPIEHEPKKPARRARKTAAKKAANAEAPQSSLEFAPASAPVPASASSGETAPLAENTEKPARKSASRRKPASKKTPQPQ
jgi:uncharacterized protein (TIGR00288 family)